MDLERIDAMSMHGSIAVENPSTIVDWSSIVIQSENDGEERHPGEEEGIPDEKPADENAMFALLGLKTEVDEGGIKLGPIVAPTSDYDLHETKEVAIAVDDEAPEEPLIGWDERHPNMDIGAPYPHMDAFRKAIKQFAINGEFEYGTKKNEPTRFRAFCKGKSKIGEPCKWSLTATWKRDENCVMVVKHQKEHICSSTSGKVTRMTSQSWVADKVTTMLKKDPTIGAVKILKELQDEHHVKLEYHTVWKGKQKAATSLYGSWEESFRMLYNYKAEIELRSPGSIVEIDTVTNEGEVHFSKLFIALKPCIDGFVNGCRPYLSIDSTHLNGKWNGQLAVVTALDGHNWMFPVAYGFIESESSDNWAWFMNQVKKAIGDPPVLAVCTDACKGLENAVKKVFPQAE